MVSTISMSVLIIFFIISAPYSLFFFSSTRADLSMKQISRSGPLTGPVLEIHQPPCARGIAEQKNHEMRTCKIFGLNLVS